MVMFAKQENKSCFGLFNRNFALCNKGEFCSVSVSAKQMKENLVLRLLRLRTFQQNRKRIFIVHESKLSVSSTHCPKSLSQSLSLTLSLTYLSILYLVFDFNYVSITRCLRNDVQTDLLIVQSSVLVQKGM